MKCILTWTEFMFSSAQGICLHLQILSSTAHFEILIKFYWIFVLRRNFPKIQLVSYELHLWQGLLLNITDLSLLHVQFRYKDNALKTEQRLMSRKSKFFFFKCTCVLQHKINKISVVHLHVVSVQCLQIRMCMTNREAYYFWKQLLLTCLYLTAS